MKRNLCNIKSGLTKRARGRLDSHRQIGFVRVFEFYPLRRQVSSRQPPVTRAVSPLVENEVL